jgi:histidine triad (HIT) family protein
VAALCIFCSIAASEIDANIVFSDEIAVAFLDHRPVFKGHTLLAPRAHVETLADLASDLIGPFFTRAQLLARAIESALGADGTFVAINNKVSQSVPHLHVHIVPRRRKDGLRGFFWPRTKYEGPDEMDDYASRISKTIAELG